MKKYYSLFICLLFAASAAFSQSTVTLRVLDSGSNAPVEDATIQSISFTGQTNASGEIVLNNIPDGTYDFTVTAECYQLALGSVTVAGANIVDETTLDPEPTNSVFFFVGSPFTLSGATVNMTGPNGYDESIVTGAILGDLFENVPVGDYDYTITLDCYETITGSVTVECLGGGQGVSVFENPQEITSNNVFFFVGSPFTLAGATVNMTGPDGYDETIITGQILGDLFENVPGGDYDYTITLDCYETITGSVTVECLGGGQGVSVFENPQEITSNDVFFFVGSPFTLSGATVNMTGPDGYDETIITGQILGDLFENVPGGEYDYTITLDCYETITGSVTVECLGGGQGVSVFENPQEITSNNVFFFVGSPFTLAGATVNMTGPDGYDESIVTGELLGDLFENVPGGEYNYTITLDCYETITGSVTVECLGGGQGVSVFENPQEITSNNVFFFVGSPFTLAGATVNMTGPDGYDETIITGQILGDLFENVPGGEYDYTITLDCYETITGSVTVECLGGGQGVSVFENPQEITFNNVFFFVGSPFTLAGATVNMTGPDGYDESIVTGELLGDLFENVPGGEYDYTITLDCYETITGSVTVECLGGGQGVSVFENPQEITSNNVFFFVGSPFTLAGATVNMTGPDGYDESIVTGELLGDLFENVPGGEYNYTITLDCYETIAGTVTVECLGGGQGVSVFENPQEITSNNVFFFVGSPFTLAGATVNMTGPDGYDESIVTGELLGDLFENVPGGEYNYTITLDCYETVTGTVTVECLGGGQGVSVSENPMEIVLDTEVTQDSNVLTASAEGVEYQWIDCSDDEPIVGETSQTFTAEANGEYAVIITSENCSSTSECFNITAVGVENRRNNLDLAVFPNPFRNQVNISLEGLEGNTTVEVYSVSGQQMLIKTSQNSGNQTLDLSNLPSGVYVLKVSNGDGLFIDQIIKQ